MPHVPRLVTVLATAALGACSTPNEADLVLRGGKVYTVDSTRPWVEAVAVREGRIVAVGTDAEVGRLVGRGTRVVDVPNGLVLPGFIDTHVHPVTSGAELGDCSLNDAATLDDVRRIVRACASHAAPDGWVRGGGFQLPIFAGGNPSRLLLDSLVDGRAAYLTSADGHNAWVSSKALDLADVTRATRDPAYGRIERDRGGNPSGTLRETAMDLVGRHVPPHTDEEYARGLARALALAARFGITTLHEASADEQVLRAYAHADSSGTLTARVVVSLHVDTDRGVEQVGELAALRDRYARGLVRPVAAKIFADGVIEGQTAALLEPYLDRPGYRGELNLPPQRFDSLVHALDSAGFKVHVHAIGDRAIRVALDAFEKQRALDHGAGPRHIIAHLQLFDPADVPRFARLGVVASFQPLWAYRDSYMKDLTEPRLGPARIRWNYPIASVVKTGAIVAGGSDWSVSSLDPLEAMQVAVTRRDLADSTGPSWIPEELVDLPTIVRAYTLGGALASDADSLVGSIVVGKQADLIVLSQDIFAIPPTRIHETKVLLTFLGGREVYRDSSALR